MNTSAKGSAKELRTAHILENEGWVVGSRRHTPGPGDLLASKEGERSRLIEVKASKTGAYQDFKPLDRRELREYAERHGMDAELAWWKPRARTHQIIPAVQWP